MKRDQKDQLYYLYMKKEKGDLIALNKVMKEMDKVDQDNLFEWSTSETRGHDNKLKKT